ncbi:FAD/NAD(P)-binding domain-containing protein [Teratosphaeria destructans]|uniref:FAD/NAD(P)-binding domain-containing protein n=1 Tax=Teratosphaeria destructans TaxID=418781 RepID=A0A9W7SZJ3_9PEZI|nr:FAD/NAD(P)-binding domain-containing protein [Teratosphaeria destructans]
MGAFKVIIVGSGLAGSCLANGLIKHDINVQVYERMRRESRREGYQIRLGEYGLKGMRACLEPPVLTSVLANLGRAGGTRESAPAIYDSNFTTLLDLSGLPGYPKSAAINRAVLRDTLAQPLEHAGRLHYGKQLAAYEIIHDGEDERVQVRFTDGTNEVCDILVAADGSHSRVNKQVGLNNIADVPEAQMMIVKSELPTEKFLRMRPELTRTPVASCNDGLSFYWATYLPDQLDMTSSSSKARFKESKGFDDSRSSCMLGISFPQDRAPSDLREWSPESKFQFAQKLVAGWSPIYEEIVEAVRGHDFYVFVPRQGTQPAANWRAKVQDPKTPELGHPRVWFVGDAIHAMLPGRGMGGNQSLLDTAMILPHLVELSKQAEQNENQLPRALLARHVNEYEAEMIPRSFEWVRKSAQGMFLETSTFQARAFFFVARLVVGAIATFYRVLGLFTHVDAETLNLNV